MTLDVCPYMIVLSISDFQAIARFAHAAAQKRFALSPRTFGHRPVACLFVTQP